MPSNRISRISESPDHTMWFVTQEGLCTFDGLNWLGIEDSLQMIPHLGETKIQIKKDGTIYVMGSTPTGYSLVKFSKGIWTRIPLPTEQKPDAWKGYFKFIEDPFESNTIEIYNDRYSYIYKKDTWNETDLQQKGVNSIITKLIKSADDYYISTQDGIYIISKNQLTKIPSTEPIYDLAFDSINSELFALGTSWVGKITKGNSIEKLVSNIHMGLFANGALTNFIYRNQRLYFSFNSPLYELNLQSGKLHQILTNGFESDHTCTDALFDHEGNLWITTLRGTYMINNLNAQSYNNSSLIEKEVSAFYEDTKGNMYLGANTGVSVIYPDGSTKQWGFRKGFLQPRVMDIVGYQNEILMAANSAGIVSVRNTGLSYDSDLINQHFTDLEVYRDTLFASTNNQLIYKSESGWKKFIELPRDEYHHATIRKILFSDSFKYLLTANGVYDMKSQTFIQSTNANENNIYCGIEYKGEVLIGTAAGVRQIADHKISPSQQIPEDFDGPIYSLLADRSGKGLWIGTERGVFLSQFGKTLHLWAHNGLAGNEINRNAFSYTQDGDLAIGTDKGLTFFHPDFNSLIIPEPDVQLKQIFINNEESKGAINIRNQNSELAFHFKTISYFLPDQINYRIRLIGYDQDWVELPYNHQTSAHYKNLAPGHYQFEVQARIENGPWGAIAQSPEIKVHAKFYQTLLFKITVGMWIVTLVFVVTKWRNKQLKVQNDRLEKMVESKTQELHTRNTELLKTIKDLKAAQGQLIQSEKLTSMGHLTAGIAHEMNNPLNYIRGGAECILKNLDEINGLVESLDGRSALEGTDYQMLMDESKSLAESILSGAAKSTEIVKSLKSFTSDGQHYFSFTDLEKEVENALTLLSNQIGFRITINRLFANVPQIECYPAKINQLIVNALLNAIQSIQESGEITIRIFRKDTNYVSLEITDNGKGIAPEHLDMVFEPFFTTKDSNSGLGLTMVRSIVQEHKGKIKLKSTQSKGTKLLIQFPVSQEIHH